MPMSLHDSGFECAPILGLGQQQSGIALVVSLVLLVVITVIGLAAISSTTIQQKITANFYDRELAFQSAEGALRVAETVITSTPNAAFIRDCSTASGNICPGNPFDDSALPSADIKTVGTTSVDAGSLVANQPQYVIEYLGDFPIPDPDVRQLSNCAGYSSCAPSQTAPFYRITVRSGPADVGDRASVTLQITFRL